MSVPRSAVDTLRRALGNRVLVPGDALYEELRPLWNARIDAHPASIVRSASAEDVAVAVRVAAHDASPVAVRGGGHSVAGHGTSDGGIVVHLGGLDHIDVDPVRRVARVGGGLSWGQVDAATARHGLATVGGQISTTGVGGLTVGGGVGWLMRRYGLTIDNLRSAEMVDARGERLRVSAEEEPDLFWAIRGGGGNFGVVTSFEFDLHPVSDVLAGSVLYAMDSSEVVMRLFADVAAEAPPALTMMVLMLAAPNQPVIPPEHRGRPVALFAACHVGDPDEGASIVAPFRSMGPPLADSLRVMPYVELQSLFDEGSRAGFRNAWRSPFLHTVDEELIGVVAEHGSRMPTAISQVLLCNMGGAVADVPEDATAFSHRQAPFYIEMIAKWGEGDDGDAAVAWADEFAAAVEPWSTGYTYVNFLDEGHPRGARLAYHPSTWERLTRLKGRYDPDNLFRTNHNIPPPEGPTG